MSPEVQRSDQPATTSQAQSAVAVADAELEDYVRRIGLVTETQLLQAREFCSAQAQQGLGVALADALIHIGAITPQQRENLEKKLQARKAGGVSKLGHYKLLRKLGEGSMGVVFLAEDRRWNRHVALKVLPRKLASNHEFVHRFLLEARAAIALHHQNIVSAYEAGEDLGHYFFAMEYLDGETLSGMLRRLRRISVPPACGMVLEVTRGLAYAHSKGILHRDIKPSNIFQTKAGSVKVLDLGLAKDIHAGEQSFSTQTGITVGTPHYMSPEQCQGEKTIDGRTDIYALGATLFHALTGDTPYEAPTTPAVLLKHINEPIPDLRKRRPDVPAALADLVRKMLAKEPAQRPANCIELLDQLQTIVEELGIPLEEPAAQPPVPQIAVDPLSLSSMQRIRDERLDENETDRDDASRASTPVHPIRAAEPARASAEALPPPAPATSAPPQTEAAPAPRPAAESARSGNTVGLALNIQRWLLAIVALMASAYVAKTLTQRAKPARAEQRAPAAVSVDNSAERALASTAQRSPAQLDQKK